MGSFYLNIRNKFRLLRSDVAVLYLASKDKRTPISTKAIIGFTILYLFSPIDVVPDFIPALGIVDDLLMVPFMVSVAIRTVPDAVLADARLRLSKAKKRLKIVLLVFLGIVLAIIGYYAYQHWHVTDF